MPKWLSTRFQLLSLGFALSGCAAATPLPDTARVMPPAFGSNGDPDVAAIDLSSWAFSRSTNTHGNIADAARAVAAVDYLAGELSSSPRWAGMSPLTKIEMLQARSELRTLLGIPLDVRSQTVVDVLDHIADAFAENKPEVAKLDLQSLAFTRSPDQVEKVLGDLPYLHTTNIATAHANAETSSSGNGCTFC